MPRGVPNSGKRMSRQPATGGAITTPPPTSTQAEPVREQIKQMSGFTNLESLKEAVPESTSAPSGGVVEPKVRKTRTVVEADPLMSDPKYRTAIGNMTAFGGRKVISSGFSTAASALKDQAFKLKEDEEQVWDEFFYVVSKRSNFDPTSPWFLASYFVIMLLTQLGSRLWERSGYKGLFSMFEKLSPKEKKSEVVPA